MTVLEKELPDEKLLMILERRNVRNLSDQLPAGMTEAGKEKKAYRDQWCALLVKLGFEDSCEKAEERYEAMCRKDEKFFLDHLYLLVDDRNQLMSACGLWYGSDFETERIRLHYVMSDPAAQKKGAARYVISRAVRDYFSLYDEALYVSTQAQSWPAIRLYASLGFEPFVDDCRKFDRKTAERRWQACRKIMREKTGSDQFK